MPRLRWTPVAFLVLGVASPSVAQPVANWAAPLYWSASSARDGQTSDTREPGAGRTALATSAREELAVSSAPLPFVSIPPCRLADTRDGSFPAGYGPPALAAGPPRDFVFVGRCGIPASAEAVSANLTVTGSSGPGFIVNFPAGGPAPVPTVSTLNYTAGQTIANAAIIPLGVAGGSTIIAGVSGTELIIDVNGYYAPGGIVNTVNTLSGDVTLAAGTNVTITPAGQTLTISASAPAGVTNVTATAPLASSGGATPDVSLTGVVPIANGGTGSATQSFVDLFNAQDVAGVKRFGSGLTVGAVPTNPLPSGAASFSGGIIVGDVPAVAPPAGSITVGPANAVTGTFNGVDGTFGWVSTSLTASSFIVCTYKELTSPTFAITVTAQGSGAAALLGSPGANFACVAFN
jgi:hypothetical protein